MEGTGRPDRPVCEERGEDRAINRIGERPIGAGIASPNRWPNEVVITKVSNGFIVRIGCQTLVGKDWDEVSNGLDFYWVRPEEAERIYCKK